MAPFCRMRKTNAFAGGGSDRRSPPDSLAYSSAKASHEKIAKCVTPYFLQRSSASSVEAALYIDATAFNPSRLSAYKVPRPLNPPKNVIQVLVLGPLTM